MSRTSPPPPQHKRLTRVRPDSSRVEVRFSGIPVSAGVAIGPIFRASEPTPRITRHKIAAADSAGEGARLDAAVVQSRKQLTKLRARLAVLPDTSGYGLCQIHGFKCAPSVLKKQPCFFNSLNGIKVGFSVSVIHGKSSSTRHADSERDS